MTSGSCTPLHPLQISRPSGRIDDVDEEEKTSTKKRNKRIHFCLLCIFQNPADNKEVEDDFWSPTEPASTPALSAPPSVPPPRPLKSTAPQDDQGRFDDVDEEQETNAKKEVKVNGTKEEKVNGSNATKSHESAEEMKENVEGYPPPPPPSFSFISFQS